MKTLYQKPITEIIEISAQQGILAGSVGLSDDEVDAGQAESRGGGFFDDDDY